MDKIFVTILIVIFLGTDVIAQYPFEKFNSPNKAVYGNWKETTSKSWADSLIHWYSVSSIISLPHVFPDNDTCNIQIACAAWDSTSGSTDCDDHSVKIRIFRNNKLVQEFNSEPIDYRGVNIDSVVVADFNNDNLQDIKFIAWYMGNGLASENLRVIYLIQQKGNNFIKHSFDDMGIRNERDMDNDGRFVIVSKELLYRNKHSYWLFNLFKFLDTALISVNQNHGYPQIIQYLNRPNYKPTRHIPDSLRNQLSKIHPREYKKDQGILIDH